MAISVAQRNTGADSGGVGGSVSVAFSSNNTAGNTIVAVLGMGDSTSAAWLKDTQPPTDTQGNIYYLVQSTGFFATSSKGLKIYVAHNIKSGANTVTVTDASSDTQLNIYEVSGLAAYATFDQGVSATFAASSGSHSSGNTPTTTYANELLIGSMVIDNATSVGTAGSGYSNLQTTRGTGTTFSEEQIISSTGAQSAAISLDTNADGTMAISTFADTKITSNVATVSSLGNTWNTTSGTHTVTATPAVNDLIVIVRGATGSTTSTNPTDNNADGNGTYTKITSALKNTSADLLEIYIRNSLVGSATSTVFTEAPGTTTGGGLTVLKVTGMTKTGASAALQSATQANQAAATPAPAFTNNITSPNPVIGAVFNASSSTITNVNLTVGFALANLSGYTTPATGVHVMFNSGGTSGKTITWGAASPSAFCDLIVELDTSGPLTVGSWKEPTSQPFNNFYRPIIGDY